MTLAPSDWATSEVRSVEALSTTMTSSTKSGMERRIFSMPCSSFRQGMMTVIDWPLYMGASRLFRAGTRLFYDRPYDEDHEAANALVWSVRSVCLLRRPGGRTQGVPVANVAGT